MARKKVSDSKVSLNSWEEVDETLKIIAEHEIALENIKGEMNKEINEVKERAGVKSGIHKDAISVLEKRLKNFVSTHRSEIDGKTKKLNFGQTGFRSSTSLSLPRGKDKVAAIIDSLKKKGMDDCVNIQESVNKEVLKKYDADTVISIGVSIKKKDEFWYECEHAEVK